MWSHPSSRRSRISGVRRLFLLACALIVCGVDTRTQHSDDLARVLAGLAERTRLYYDRFVSIICTETVQIQNLSVNLAPVGRPRTTVYELSVSRDPTQKREGGFRVERTLQSVNGRPARKNQRAECTDPKTGTPEPLGFLLASNQKRYRFALSDAGGGPPGTRAIDFTETPPERVSVKWEGNCFEADGGGHQGRIWFDPETYDIFEAHVRLSKPFLVPLPDGFFGIRPAIRVEKSETTLRFSRVAFQQPDEAVMLPASVETLHALRGVPSLRIHQTLANYRRFLTESEIRTRGF
jgi:hypothetical protein